MLTAFTYNRPETLKALLQDLKQEETRIHAGGTDLLGCLRDGVFSAKKVVSISALDDLKSIKKQSNGSLRIGALVTIHHLATDPEINNHYPTLAQAAGEVASPQLREQGTIGGNLCQKPRCWYYRGEFPCLRKGGKKCFALNGQNQFHAILGGSACHIVHPSDTAPALIALDASLEIQGSKGKRTLPVAELHVPAKKNPLREIYLEDNEIITAVHLPAPSKGRQSSYRKVRARQSWDFAVAGVAIALTLEGDKVKNPRIVLSGAAPIPWRSPAAENVLAGQAITEDIALKTAEAAMADARPLEHNGYKVPLFKGMITEELLKYADV
jgi:xanthine dehydrogenase YagS FAD-binding subunit